MRRKPQLENLAYCFGIISISVAATFFFRSIFDFTLYVFMVLGVVVCSLRAGVLYGIFAIAVGVVEYVVLTAVLLRKQHTAIETDLATVFVAVSLVIAWLAGKRQEALSRLSNVVQELQTASEEVKTLRGLIPICAGCKKIRDEEGLWVGIERYLEEHTDAQMTHGMCRDCIKRLYPDVYPQIYPEPGITGER